MPVPSAVEGSIVVEGPALSQVEGEPFHWYPAGKS
jgi:hypothetical protein